MVEVTTIVFCCVAIAASIGATIYNARTGKRLRQMDEENKAILAKIRELRR